MKKLTSKTLAVIMAALMIFSVTPLIAFAAPARLSYRNCVVTEVPTVSPTEFDYGVTYEELTVTGGKITYNGTSVDGYFSFRGTGKVAPCDNEYVSLYFNPTDTATYRGGYFTYDEEYLNNENWPKLTVRALDAELSGEVAAAAINPGDTLSKAAITATVVDSKTKTPITDGKWTYSSTGIQAPNRAVLESGEFEAVWTCTGYNSITVKVNVTVNDTGTPPSGVSIYPTVKEGVYYTDGMVWADVVLDGGRAIYEGKEVSGHFEWFSPQAKVSSTSGSMWAWFIPDDEAYKEFFAQNSQAINVPYKLIKRPFNITKVPEELVFVYKSGHTTTCDAVYVGFEFGSGEGEFARLKWTENVNEKEVGTYPAMKVTLYDKDGLYQTQEFSIPVRIVNEVTDKPFGTLRLDVPTAQKEEGEIRVNLAFDDNGKGGTVTVKLGEEILAEGITSTYAYGSSARYHNIKYVAPETGTYTFTAEYFPAETDTIIYSSNILTASVDITVRTARTITVNGGSAWEKVSYVGDRMQVTVGKEEMKSFSKWEFTDADGNVIPSAELGITDEDLTKTELTFTMPDCDITATAKQKGLASIFEKILTFFENLFGGEGESECVIIKWLGKIFGFIASIFTFVFNAVKGIFVPA